MNALEARASRLAELIGAVARQALADRGCARIALLDDRSPEAELAARWLHAGVGADRMVSIDVGAPQVESVLHALRPDPGGTVPADPAALRGEVRRLCARLVPDALVANPCNKTALLLGGPLPPEPLLPLGDLYAGEVEQLTGAWSAPEPVRELVRRCGGVHRLDAALRACFDLRDWLGLDVLEPSLRREVQAALHRGAASRIHPAVVPKLGSRTIGVDLFE
jgi:hypothetical protein